MERLTTEIGRTVCFTKGKFPPTSCAEMDAADVRECMEALACYEDLGLKPAQIRTVDNLYAAKCREVANLQKQLENSVKMPCAYNDTMYWIVRGHIREVWFKGIRCDYGYKPQIICRYIDNLKTKETAICEVDQIGKTLFLTRDAAEKALSEVKA